MFHSPSIRLYSSENAESAMVRKPGNVLVRKPFIDRSVNSKTPDTGKLQKSKLNIKGTTVEKPKLSPILNNDLSAEEFTYSFKDVKESYEDIWPKSRLSSDDLIQILRNYCNVEDTPPPSPEPAPIEINPIFFELPHIEMPDFQLEEEPANEVIDIDLPYLDDSELDFSM
ncbi:uncharacterized protein LOC108912083 [Anoplophora glabripennis]|uniref:Uncharacterized protein n=1 Tax=Anoplophora glabripennis TaxID=217634 RepID=V5H560_ANOGL|nr:uncharacterized protein LOC108912083 [Anoplophora glabripennis]